jgi:hypothetical protein
MGKVTSIKEIPGSATKLPAHLKFFQRMKVTLFRQKCKDLVNSRKKIPRNRRAKISVRKYSLILDLIVVGAIVAKSRTASYEPLGAMVLDLI